MARYARSYDYDDYDEAPVVAAAPVRRDRSLGIFALAILLIVLVLTNQGMFSGWNWSNPFATSPVGATTVPQIVTPTYQYGAPTAPAYSGRAWVAASSLYVRPNPGFQYNPVYVLPQETEVYLVGETHRDQYGEDWVKVQVNTEFGPQQGWVSGKYLRA